MPNFDQLLQNVTTRRLGTRWGIGVAKHYLAGFGATVPDGVAPEDWQAALKQSESRLVYCNPGMKLLGRAAGSSESKSILEFDCVITSKRKDRDGDILEPKGAVPDLKMPLLWQHLPFQPIGKLLAITGQTPSKVSGRFGIADLPLGRDAAVLVDFEALRISHGFQPLEFEPLAGEKDGEEPTGWHITKYEIMETSLVSIPSNTDAVITAFSRGKLHDPLTKAWARSLWSKKPTTVTVPRDIPSDDKGWSPAGSWESTRELLCEKLSDFLQQLGLAGPDDDCYVAYMFPKYAIVCVYVMGSGEVKHYSIDWKMESGEPAWYGEPAVVEITTQIIERSAMNVAKAGRVLSSKNETALKDAMEMIDEASGHKDCTKPIKALLKQAKTNLQDVLDQLTSDDGEEEQDGDKEVVLLRDALNVVLQGKHPGVDKFINAVRTAGSLRDKAAADRIWSEAMSALSNGLLTTNEARANAS